MKKFDVIIVGTGVSGLFAALNLHNDRQIAVLTKAALNETDSFWRRAVYVCRLMMKISKVSWRIR